MTLAWQHEVAALAVIFTGIDTPEGGTRISVFEKLQSYDFAGNFLTMHLFQRVATPLVAHATALGKELPSLGPVTHNTEAVCVHGAEVGARKWIAAITPLGIKGRCP
jgi:hypothetical protein